MVLGYCLLESACSTTLQQPGPYNGDQYLYATDVTITSAYSILNAFVKYEYDNRAALAGNPAIRQAADDVRAHAKQWISSAIAIREAYAANPTTANKASLDQAITVLQAALNEAVKYLTVPPAAPAAPATAPPAKLPSSVSIEPFVQPARTIPFAILCKPGDNIADAVALAGLGY